jgi:hypothetical protein
MFSHVVYAIVSALHPPEPEKVIEGWMDVVADGTIYPVVASPGLLWINVVTVIDEYVLFVDPVSITSSLAAESVPVAAGVHVGPFWLTVALALSMVQEILPENSCTTRSSNPPVDTVFLKVIAVPPPEVIFAHHVLCVTSLLFVFSASARL